MLNFGSFIDRDENTDYFLDYLVFVGALIINVILMLNILISILGDSYEKFQEKRTVIDYREKIEYMLDLQKIMIWIKTKTSLLYLHGMTSPFEEEEEELRDLNERIICTEQKDEKDLSNLQSNPASFSKESNASIEKELKDTKISVEAKISLVESKISSVEAGLKENISSIEAKISSVEEKLNRVLDILTK